MKRNGLAGFEELLSSAQLPQDSRSLRERSELTLLVEDREHGGPLQHLRLLGDVDDRVLHRAD
eukprot:3896174-Rhodomonas_salina.4